MARRPIYDKIGASPDIYVHKWDYDADTGLRHERPKSRWHRYQAVSRDGHTYLRQIAPEEQDLARSMLLLAQALAREPAQPLPAPVDDSAQVPPARDTLAEAVRRQQAQGLRQ